MPNPQQPELHRSGYGETTSDAQQLRAPVRDHADETTDDASGAPTPSANATQDERRSGSASKTRDALEG